MFTSKPFRIFQRLLILVFTGFSAASSAQTYPATFTPRPGSSFTAFDDKIKGYYEYLPSGYSNPSNSTKQYPVILYLPGCGELGDGEIYYNTNGTVNTNLGLGRLFRVNAIPTRVRNNMSYFSSVTVNGQSYGFIILCLQYWGEHSTCQAYSWPTAENINNAINYAISKYRVDKSRIYLTGMSVGGDVVWSYPGASTTYGRRLAANAPVAAVSTYYSYTADNCAAANVPTLAIVNIGDQSGGQDRYMTNKNLIDRMNQFMPAPNPPAEGMYFNALGHDAWTEAYRTGATVFAKGGTSYNLYQWFLLNQRDLTLPVLLKGFDAFYKDKKVVLNWITSNEKNNDYFTLERSNDGKNFTVLNKINGAGNYNTDRNYQFTDNNLPAGKIIYYRLSQTDIDGKKEIFGVKRIYVSSSGYMVKVYPTITTDRLVLEVEGSNNEAISVKISDISGKVLKEQMLAPRQKQLVMSVSELTKGVYIVQTKSSTDQSTIKIIRQ